MNLLTGEPGRFGGDLYAARLHELAPGEASPYHWHVGEEEFLLVLRGTPTLRTPHGERVLRPWDVAWFPAGETGCHQVRNDTDETARIVFFSSLADADVRVYPDEGLTAVSAGPVHGHLERS